MAKIELLIQAFETGDHADALKNILSISNLNRFVASVAFVRKEGVNAIAKEIQAVADRCVFFIGIRNDITSIQAIRRLIELGVQVFAVDTASRATLFHPKMFLGVGAESAFALVGSANMTYSGLHNNVEASTIIDLDPSLKQDTAFIEAFLVSIDQLPSRFPKHVFQIVSECAANSLFEQGRLVDEDVVTTTPTRSFVRKGERDNLKPISLPRHAIPRRKKVTNLSGNIAVGHHDVSVKEANSSPVAPITEFILIWESKALKERDLNIPTGEKTNATGSMLWKKGVLDNVDQRHFFRDEIFSELSWSTDSKLPHYERAEAEFTLIIKGLNYGNFILKLSHNTNIDSQTYKQGNGMTSVRWGPVSKLIRERDLLHRKMYLYKNGRNPPQYLIEID
jgi:HKD family nuclease